MTQAELCRWLLIEHNLKVSQGTVSNTLKRSAELLSLPKNASLAIKRHRNAKYPLTEKALAEWFEIYQGTVMMSGDLIKEKGKYFQSYLYHGSDFHFSNGGLDSFKVRHGIKNYRRFGESASVDTELIARSLPDIRKKLDAYALKDIYNMDETGLFYRMSADISSATRQLEGRKKDKERLTLTICCNGDGSDKLPLWIIGKSFRPRCLKNINLSNIKMEYHANKKVWMTLNLFRKWLEWFDARMQGRKVLLIMDNCPAHLKVEDLPPLSNTEVFYLPPNTTSKIQPCDAGVIRAFKAYYRKFFNQKVLSNIENQQTQPEKITILEGIKYAIEAWNSVKSISIANCFNHCKIRTQEGSAITTLDMVEDRQIINIIQQQMQKLKYPNPMSLEYLLKYPSEEETTYVPTEEEIAESLLQSMNVVQDDEEEDDSEEIPIITVNSAVELIEKAGLFLMQQPTNENETVEHLQHVLKRFKEIREKSKSQMTLDKYFLPSSSTLMTVDRNFLPSPLA